MKKKEKKQQQQQQPITIQQLPAQCFLQQLIVVGLASIVFVFTFIFNISLNNLIPAMAEGDYLIFFTGEGEQRVGRRLKKSQVTTERLAQMIGVSHNAEALGNFRELKQRQ